MGGPQTSLGNRAEETAGLCSYHSVVPEPHQEEEAGLPVAKGLRLHAGIVRETPPQQIDSAVVSKRHGAEAELMKETIFGPHSENTVLFMNELGRQHQTWTLCGTYCHIVFVGKAEAHGVCTASTLPRGLQRRCD